MGQHVPDAFGLVRFHRMQGADGEYLPVGNVFLEQEYTGRNDDGDNGDRRRQVFRSAQLAEEFLVYQHRQGDVVFTDQHRRAVIGKRPHEHQQGAGQQRRQHQRQDHLEYLADSRAAKAFAGFNQAVVHALEGARNEHEHQAVQLEAHDNDTAFKSVNIPQLDSNLRQQVGHNSVSAAQLDPGVGADKRCGHGRYEDQDLQDSGSPDLHRRHDIGHGGRDEDRYQRHHGRNQQRMPDGVAVIGLAEYLFIHFK